MVWINKILGPLRIAPWKILFIDQYNEYGADKIWMLDQYVLSKVASCQYFYIKFCKASLSYQQNNNENGKRK
jgi:hypothetical protein